VAKYVRLKLLGHPQIKRSGRPVSSLPSGKSLAFLGYIVAQRQPLYREHLADLLWQDSPVERRRANLSWTLHKLSVTLPGCLTADHHTVQFHCSDRVRVDLYAFESLERQQSVAALTQAVALYRAPFLLGLSLIGCPDFELWLVRERERWQQHATMALTKLITHHRNLNEAEEGLHLARRLLQLEPWREAVHRQVMCFLAEGGQRGAALVQYEVCCRELREELGVTPSAETVSLYLRIRDGGTGGPGTPLWAGISKL